MVYVKVDTDFFKIEELARIAMMTVRDVETCIDRGLFTATPEEDNYVAAETSSAKRIRLACELEKMGVVEPQKSVILDALEVLPDAQIEREAYVDSVVLKYDLSWDLAVILKQSC